MAMKFLILSLNESTDLTVQLVRADAQPGGGGLRLPVGGAVGRQQVQSPQRVDVEVFLQLHSSFQHADGVGRLLLQLRGRTTPKGVRYP